MENVPKELMFINNDLWWHKENVNEYEYQLKVNKQFISKISPHLTGNDVVIQAGGSCGWLVREMYSHFKYIYTFEPNYLSFLCLCLNLPYPNVFKFNSCIGNERNLVSMSDHYDNLSSSGYIKGDGKIPTLMIDDLNVDKCDFIQLDLEGYEYHGLLGAKNTIEKFKPLICVECRWQFRYGNTVEDMDKHLTDVWGYKLIDSFNDDRLYKR